MLYSGTLACASDAVLESSKAGTVFSHKSTPEDDLHALVRTAYLMTYPSARGVLNSKLQHFRDREDATVCSIYAKAAIQLWHTFLSESLWRDATLAASGREYDAVKRFIPVPVGIPAAIT